MMRLICLAAGILAIAAPATAQGIPDYRDDRSTPAAVVESLYNAIGRYEFARAWSYFIEPPATTFVSYADGFANTESVAIEIGAIAGDCGVGTCNYEVPVILRAIDTGGQLAVYSGCYLIREVTAGVQTPPFRPLGIVSGRFSVANPNSVAFQPDCGGGSAVSSPSSPVTALFVAAQSGRCTTIQNAYASEPRIYDLRFRYSWDEPDAPQRLMRLYQFSCSGGAYNLFDVFYLEDEYGDISPVSFAYPDIDVTYVDEEQTVAEAVSVRGYFGRDMLGLAGFDPATQSIYSFVKWRGLGDASESGVWVFENGEFRLDAFEVDPTFDGEINPLPLIEGGEAVAGGGAAK